MPPIIERLSSARGVKQLIPAELTRWEYDEDQRQTSQVDQYRQVPEPRIQPQRNEIRTCKTLMCPHIIQSSSLNPNDSLYCDSCLKYLRSNQYSSSVSNHRSGSNFDTTNYTAKPSSFSYCLRCGTVMLKNTSYCNNCYDVTNYSGSTRGTSIEIPVKYETSTSPRYLSTTDMPTSSLYKPGINQSSLGNPRGPSTSISAYNNYPDNFNDSRYYTLLHDYFPNP